MKILFITGSLPPIKCGIGFYSDKLLSELSIRASIHVLTTEGYASTTELPTKHVRDWRLKNLGHIYSICKKSTSDCFVLQYPALGYKRNLGINLVPFMIRFIIRKPIIVTLHEYHGSGILGKLRNLITIMPADKVFVSNEYDMMSLPKIIRKKTIIIPIGSNIDVYSGPSIYEKVLNESGFSKFKKTGVFFGFPNQNKGLDILLKSVEESNSQLLIVAGIDQDNAYHTNIAKKVMEMETRGIKIRLTGYLPDEQVSSVLSGADYFVLPQPLPLTAKSGTAIAAVIHGLPIISTGSDDEALNYPYINGKNAMLLNPMNSNTLTSVLNDINNNKIDLELISKNLKEMSIYFDWRKIASKYIYEIGEDIK